ncbi:MAG: hypothetical protein ACI9NC_006045 [Verrucomicrobiales bacterium]|jgi:hypothetical protein
MVMIGKQFFELFHTFRRSLREPTGSQRRMNRVDSHTLAFERCQTPHSPTLRPMILNIRTTTTALALCLATTFSALAESGDGTTRGVIDPATPQRPAKAIQLVGESSHELVPQDPEKPSQWVFSDGVLTASPAWDSLVTKDSYGDFRMHVEFNVNEGEDAADKEKNGNSGIYIQQRYELQILNSFGVAAADYKASYGGSLYKLKKPDLLVNKKAGEWQSYDIAFRAARFDGDQKIADARITAYQNGQLIHDDFPIPRKTGAGEKEAAEPRPIKLQGHHNTVRFRNVWIEALDLSSAPTTDVSSDAHPVPAGPLWLTYKGADGPGKGKHIVLIAADQEYRSEQSLPMLARLLAAKHGFDCTVLFGVNEQGLVDPTMPVYPKKGEEEAFKSHNIPGLEHLETADLVIFKPRLLTLPEEQKEQIVKYLESGKPIIGLRTANHGFRGSLPYKINGKNVRFGDDILGGAFRGHHGNWHADSTRGIVIEEAKDHPILIGVEDVWGPSDVYRTYPEGQGLPDGCVPLLMGQPLLGRQPEDKANPKKIPLPIAWTKAWTGNQGKTARVFHLTMGSARDFQSAGVRRLTINAAYWCMHLEKEISADRSVEIQGPYAPKASGFNYEKLGVFPQKPSELR